MIDTVHSNPKVRNAAYPTWDSIDPAIIVRAFKKCSITNELDGTEDNILWQDDRDAPCADSDIEKYLYSASIQLPAQ